MSRQLLLAKKEVTYGVDPGPVAINTLWAENVKYTPKGTIVTSDPAKPSVTGAPSQIYAEHGELTFDIPLAASGTAGTAPKWGPLVQAAGWGETIVATTSVTYARRDDPSASDSLSFVWREKKRLHKMLGSRGRMGVKFVAGERPMLSFTFLGLYVPVEAGAALVAADATFTGWNDAKPVAQGRTMFSFGGVAMPLRELSLEAGDNVKFNDLPHQENVQLLGDSTYTGKIKATVPAIGTFNPETAAISRGKLTSVLVHETTAGSIVTLTGLQQVEQPTYSDDGGEDVFEQSVTLLGSTMALSDDLILVLT